MNMIADISTRVPFNNKTKLLIDDYDQDTTGIMEEIRKRHNQDKISYDQFALEFWDGNAERTAKKIFDFLKKNVRYQVEPEETQTVKSPGAILKQLHGDCKHYSLWATGIADSLNRQGYPIAGKYRFVSDSPGRDVHHVFSVISGPGGEYWCDPVISQFNERPKFYNTKDFNMAVYSISGTDRGKEVAQVGLSFKKNPFKQFVHSIEVNAKNVQHGMQVNTANFKHGMEVNAANAKTAILKVGLVPMRKAFLGLVALNVRSLATNLNRWRGRPEWAQIMHKWQKDFGGDPKTLDQAIHNGAGRKRLGYYQSIGVLGVDDAAIASWTALASAILLALKQFIHAPGGDTEKAEAASAAKGTGDMLANAYNSAKSQDEAGNQPAAAATALDALTAAPATGTGSMAITPSVAADGSPTIAVHDVDHPVIQDAATPDNADGTPPAPTRDVSDVVATIKGDLMNFWAGFKVPILMIGGGYVAYRIATRAPRKRRR